MSVSPGDIADDGCRVADAHRRCEPAETVRRVSPLFERCGITRVANLTGLDRVGIPVVAVYRPNARSVAVSQGKGRTLAAARASGVMEAIEVWHAERCDVPLRRASAAEMRATRGVCDLGGLPRAAGGAEGDPAAPRHWVEGVDLSDGAALWCPLETVDADYTRHDVRSEFLRSTNGLASGNGWPEAVGHGLCELIERDAVSVWRARARRLGRLDGRVDPASVDDPACRELLARYAEAAVDVGLWDIASDTGVPAFLALVVDRDEPDGIALARPANGKGCHPSKAVALSRALTEAAQTRLTYISGARDDLSDEDYDASAQRDNVRRARAMLDERATVAPLDYRGLADHATAGIDADVAHLLDALGGIGLEQAIAIDLAPGTPEVAVARVVVPGLEGPDEHPAWRPGTRALSA